MLTRGQIDLVQNSFIRVLPVTALAAEVFYGRLFALAPDTRALFRGDMADQGRKLFLTLAAVVDSLDSLDRVVPTAEALAIRHIGYGARSEHYAVVGVALLDMLRAVLDRHFDSETAGAWSDAYAVLLECMLAAVRRSAAAVHDTASAA